MRLSNKELKEFAKEPLDDGVRDQVYEMAQELLLARKVVEAALVPCRCGDCEPCEKLIDAMQAYDEGAKP